MANSKLLCCAVFVKGQAKTNYLSDAAVDCIDTFTHSDLGFVSDSSVRLVGAQLSQRRPQHAEQ